MLPHAAHGSWQRERFADDMRSCLTFYLSMGPRVALHLSRYSVSHPRASPIEASPGCRHCLTGSSLFPYRVVTIVSPVVTVSSPGREWCPERRPAVSAASPPPGRHGTRCCATGTEAAGRSGSADSAAGIPAPWRRRQKLSARRHSLPRQVPNA